MVSLRACCRTNYKFGEFSDWVGLWVCGFVQWSSSQSRLWFSLARASLSRPADVTRPQVNVFKPGTGTITVFENVGGTRGEQVYQLKGIPLTPGPLVAVIKVAASVTHNISAYWPPSQPDAIETIAASYVDTDPHSKVRLCEYCPLDSAFTGHCCGCAYSVILFASKTFARRDRRVASLGSNYLSCMQFVGL
eukprot:SAG11_NODE_10000_length_863_cov_1.535340_2_plen_192_part_00